MSAANFNAAPYSRILHSFVVQAYFTELPGKVIEELMAAGTYERGRLCAEVYSNLCNYLMAAFDLLPETTHSLM